uniref:40S ribosomal protein S8 n=1 Tax=Ailuropoda melanoleuca TaxID=9646 RepID=A0A7N5K7V6_AILME
MFFALSQPAPRAMGISRDNWHKRRKTGGKRKPYHKKRKYELGRPAANTKIGPRRIHTVRVRGGNKKYRALRLDVGNFSWGSESSGIGTESRHYVWLPVISGKVALWKMSSHPTAGLYAQNKDNRCCLQRIQQRTGPHQDPGEELYCAH